MKLIEPGPIRTDFYDRSMDVARKSDIAEYEPVFNRTMPHMQKAGANAPGPAIVAESIWRATTDGSSRLRYTPNSAGILALRRLLPDRVFQALVRRAIGI